MFALVRLGLDTGCYAAHDVGMTQPQTPWKALREATGLSQREISRRTGINSGRLSIIERGVPPHDWEADILRKVLGSVVLGGES